MTRRVAVIAGLVLILAIATFATFRPKSIPLQSSPNILTGYYRGGWPFPRQFYKVVMNEGPNGYCEFDVSDVGYRDYRGYYPNGTLKEQGEVRVTISGAGDTAEPFPDRHDVRNGTYYRLDGSVDSTVQDGTGVQCLRNPNGLLTWRLTLQNYRRVHLQVWNDDGSLRLDKHYEDP
jgi:hypothetical protein